MKKVLVTAVALTMLVGGYLSFTTVDKETAQAVAGKQNYKANVYVAGMGGHFAVADVTIDPNNSEAPITVNNLGMLNIGGKSHPTHDGRIDANDRNIMFWSTYRPDDNGNLHVGKSDLKTGRVLLLHEDTLTAGFGGELAAIIAEHAFEYLDAPIVRVASWDTPVPFAVPLEQCFLPKGRLRAAVEKLAGY